jgi:hypothetical protein
MAFSCVRLLNDMVEVGPLTVMPEKTDVFRSTVEEVHVLGISSRCLSCMRL